MGDSRQLPDRSDVWDPAYEEDEESEYECYACGTIVSAEGSPVTCPDCDGQLRNREMSIE